MERQTSSQTVDLATDSINNAFYDELEDGWYTATNHPIALLRAENKVRVPWIIEQIGDKKRVLDVGCGAGILTNALAKKGHQVHGIDLSEQSLKIGAKRDSTQSVSYQVANAYDLPYPDQFFDVVCAMDVLEHVEDPSRLISEASRVLQPGGLFFFHTFNRTLLSYLLVIKGVEWFVPNTPKNMHVYPLFIKPIELKQMCGKSNLDMREIKGFRPELFNKALLKMIFKRKVPEDFGFCFSKSLLTGYCGFAQKKEGAL